MITPDEIMIGNLFMFKPDADNDYARYWNPLTKQHEKCFMFTFTNENWLDVNECVLDLNYLHPVSIGDIKNLPEWFEGHERFKLEDQGNDEVIIYAVDKEQIIYLKPIKYVHDFQNIYYILTGKKFEAVI